MSKMFKTFVLTLFLCVSSGLYSSPDKPGQIRGKLFLDHSWERTIYISLIETFEKEFAVSDHMIIGSSPIDSLGRFTINLDILPKQWCFLRLHIVKKENPPASLIIGGSEENYCFLIADYYSTIQIHNTAEKPVFKNLSVSGAPYLKTFQYIINLKEYPNSINYENSLIEKEFVAEVVAAKLKIVADTCTNPLVSLYSLYQTDFHADAERDPAFYKEYLSKWKGNNSASFQSFRRQLPVTQKPGGLYLFILIIIAAGILFAVTIFLRNGKKRKLKKLSVQERKVFELLQKGASNQEISDAYNIEISTVKSHVSNIFSKLNIKSRKEAINIKKK
ncbi:helix-turn-helix domain-containing protein [Abyssalbus ytuae]|uniref:Helix-turn-helix transcriptional regulator n=1 Tax=Abyssalbus ytuae TaxID=2926907 RepID=A0A9E6ZMC3_9FLAO|nr:helix-turn-helix transcriptional regulator [Abyssalbus ytuae]UOB18479.1 helix-turn-helix transcriptional regulator [Abyssalbus ytuae]